MHPNGDERRAVNSCLPEQEHLRPISEGRWDREKAYNGMSLFLKAIYTGQVRFAARRDSFVKRR
jgi:hypothetical protein